MQRHSSRQAALATRLLLHCSLLGLLLACEPGGPDPAFDDYLSAVSAALSLEAHGSQSGRIVPPPLPATLQVEIAAAVREPVDILVLSGCALQRNIIRRDTSLARAAKPSQQLLLTLEYLRDAPPCIEQLRGRNDALAARLRDTWLDQRSQLPALIFNTTLGGDEYGAFWRTTSASGEYPRVSSRETTFALRSIEALAQRWLDGDYRAQDRDVELLLAGVAGGDGGERLETLSRRGETLQYANQMLARRGGPAMRCSGSTLTAFNTSFPLALRNQFLHEVQPRYHRSLHHYHRLAQPITSLEARLHEVLPHAYRRWMEERDRRMATLAAAPQRHLQLFERHLHACAMQ